MLANLAVLSQWLIRDLERIEAEDELHQRTMVAALRAEIERRWPRCACRKPGNGEGSEGMHMLATSMMQLEDRIAKMPGTDEQKEAELGRIERHAHELRETLEPDPLPHVAYTSAGRMADGSD